jgi:DNA-binding MarR family transcriptional regulator
LVHRKLLTAHGTLYSMAERTPPDRAAGGQQILPLVEHLARVGRRSADAGMSGCLRARHLIALKLLGEHGPMTQHAVGTALSLDPSNVVGLLNELEERGLVVRRRDPADRRRHIVELSTAGSGELGQTCDKLDRVEDDLFKALTADERALLYGLLARAVSALAPASCTAAQAAPCAAPEDDEK